LTQSKTHTHQKLDMYPMYIKIEPVRIEQ
jgi:hypothetical protein